MADTRTRWRDITPLGCAPVLLVIVASAQMLTAHLVPLSPWKGGGFGMFSTVDSPSARSVRVALILDDERLPVIVPSKYRSLERELKTAPRRNLLRDLAEKMAAGTWAYSPVSTAMERYHGLLAEEPVEPAQLPGSQPGDPKRNRATAASLSVQGLKNLAFLRMVQNDVVVDAEKIVEFDAVDVQLWSYTFDSARRQLTARRIMRGTACR